MRNLLIALVAPIYFVSCPAIADNQFSLGSGFDYSSGKYGNTVATDILYVPVTGKYETEDFTFKLTVPYISITGPGGVVRGIGRLGRIITRTTKTTNSGLGDVTSSLTYSAYSGESLSLDLVGNAKFGTADVQKGLGTGENDYSGQVDGYYALDDTTLFATAGYKTYGSPAGQNLSNTSYGTIGVSQKVSKKISMGGMFDTTESASATSTATRELTVYLTNKISSSLKIQVNVLRGFSSASPDYGFGGMVTGIF